VLDRRGSLCRHCSFCDSHSLGSNLLIDADGQMVDD